MAKLNKALANKAAEAAGDWNDRGVLDPGLYLCKLVKVDTTRTGNAGPYWVWEYETVEVEGQPSGRKFWDNTSLSEKAIGRLGKVFEAFSQTTDADTDDLVGDFITLDVTVGVIQAGDRKGEKTNRVQSVLPAERHPRWEEFSAQFETEEASADDLG